MPTTLTPTRVGGRYRLLSELGRGGMATVYRAFDESLDREVAVKMLHAHLASDPVFLERFRREARAAAALAHPNVVGVHDWGEADDAPYLVLQLVEGPTLRELLRVVGQLEPDEAVAVLGPVATGLGAAHRAHLVHRDVKPENILLGLDGAVRITDFGLARAAATASTTFGTDVLVGSPHYLSPEAVKGQPLDARSDVYALGVVLYECLTGRPPHEGESAYATALAHTTHRVPPPSRLVAELDPGFDEIVAWSTSIDPTHRYDDAHDFARALSHVVPRPPPIEPLIAEVTVDVADDERQEAPTERPPTSVAVIDHDAATEVIPSSGGRRRSRAWLVMIMTLLLIGASGYGGLAAYDRWFAPIIDIPDVIGAGVESATAQIVDAGFRVEVATDAVHDLAMPAGHILAQEPVDQARRGSTIVLTLSAGPRQISVPSIEAMTPNEAALLLRDQNFVVTIEQRYDAQVPEGDIVTTEPAEGATVDEGSPIAVIVSQGPQPREVANLVDLSLGEAQAQATAQDWELVVAGSRHDEAPLDTVIEQVPAAGTLRVPGSTIEVIVSEGPPPVTIPSVRGERVADAVATLERLGLRVTVERRGGIGALLNPGRVFDQDPGPGATRLRGDTITVFAYE